MNRAGQTKFLVGLLVLALAAYAFTKRGKKTEVQTSASQNAQAAQPVQEPPAAVQQVAVPTPVPMPVAQPPANKLPPPPPMPAIPPDVKKRLAEINANLPKGIPKEYMEMVNRQKRRVEASAASEAQAKVELKEMEKCIQQANSMKAPDMPAGASAPAGGMAGMQAQMQASCAQFAQQLVQKYPSLKNEFNANIVQKMSPEARRRANQQAPGCCGR